MLRVGYRLNKRKKIKFVIITLILLGIVFFNSNIWSDFNTDTVVNNPSKKYFSKDLATFRKNLQCSQILKRTTKCTDYFSSLASIIYNNISNHKSYVEKYINNNNNNQTKVQDKTRVAVSYIIHQDPGTVS